MLKLDSTFPREAISWRPQHVSNGKALALAYIDARDVTGRLDAVCGPFGWQSEHYDCGGGRMACKIGIYAPGEGTAGDKYGQWIWKSDGAGGTQIEADKGAFSDSFKRAAVQWGVGRYLYDFGATWVPCETYEKNGKEVFKKFTDDPWKFMKPKKAGQGLHGPLTMTELGKRLRTMAGELFDIEDLGSLETYLAAEKAVLAQCERDLPDWFFGRGDSKGLEETIADKQKELKSGV